MKRKKITDRMLLGAAGLFSTLVFSMAAIAQDAPKYPITAGTDGRTTMWTDVSANTGGAHGTRVYCAVSHLSYDDPVVFPGEPKMAHLHTFWGNTETDYASTGQSLLNGGKSSCEGGLNNRSGYWVPTLFDENDQAMIPDDVIVYYKSFGSPNFDRNTIQAIPNGLQMLTNRSVKNSSSSNFKHFPINSGERLQLNVSFPTCVAVNNNGTPVLESADNTSHLSYGSVLDGNANDCPSSHPYRIPQVIYNIRYQVDPSSDWYLSSDTSATTQGQSLHADYIAAWDTDSMRELVRCNIEERGDCEFGGRAGHRTQLEDRHKSPEGELLYRYGLLKSAVDRTPFGTELKKSHGHTGAMPPMHGHMDPMAPVIDSLVLKVNSLSSGSAWVIFQSGPNGGQRQWVSESCRVELSGVGVSTVLISDYYSEIDAIPPVSSWMGCDTLLGLIPAESLGDDFVLKVNSLSSGSGWVVFESGPNAGQYQWVSESCRAELSGAGVSVVLIDDYYSEIDALPAVAEWQSCDIILDAI